MLSVCDFRLLFSKTKSFEKFINRVSFMFLFMKYVYITF